MNRLTWYLISIFNTFAGWTEAVTHKAPSARIAQRLIGSSMLSSCRRNLLVPTPTLVHPPLVSSVTCLVNNANSGTVCSKSCLFGPYPYTLPTAIVFSTRQQTLSFQYHWCYSHDKIVFLIEKKLSLVSFWFSSNLPAPRGAGSDRIWRMAVEKTCLLCGQTTDSMFHRLSFAVLQIDEWPFPKHTPCPRSNHSRKRYTQQRPQQHPRQ